MFMYQEHEAAYKSVDDLGGISPDRQDSWAVRRSGRSLDLYQDLGTGKVTR